MTQRVEPGQRDPLTDAELSAATLELELGKIDATILMEEEHLRALKLRRLDIADKWRNALGREESKRERR